MTSFLIVSKDQTSSLQMAQAMCKKRSIQILDQTIIDRQFLTDDSNKQLKQSIGIEDIKKMQQTLLLKPFKSKEKAIIITECELLTIPAQNALLKSIEEPPQNTLIFLLSKKKDILLPTILSRCQIIELEKHTEVDNKEIASIIETINTIPHASTGELFLLAEIHAKKKEEFLEWCEHLMMGTRDLLLRAVENNKDTHYYSSVLVLTQEAYIYAQTTNVTPRLICEQMLLRMKNG